MCDMFLLSSRVCRLLLEGGGWTATGLARKRLRAILGANRRAKSDGVPGGGEVVF